MPLGLTFAKKNIFKHIHSVPVLGRREAAHQRNLRWHIFTKKEK
jgi:hypothetical protein